MKLLTAAVILITLSAGLMSTARADDTTMAPAASASTDQDAATQQANMAAAEARLDQRLKEEAESLPIRTGCQNLLASAAPGFFPASYTQSVCEDREAQRLPYAVMDRNEVSAYFAFVLTTKHLSNAVTGTVYFKTPQEACQFLGSHMATIDGDQLDGAIAKCTDAATVKLAALRQELVSGLKKPETCREWAISKGADWEAAGFNMQYSPLATTKIPAIFDGAVTDADPARLLVEHSTFGSVEPAVVKIGKSTVIFQRDRIMVGSGITGYGLQVGQQRVRQMSWSTPALVVNAGCIEAL